MCEGQDESGDDGAREKRRPNLTLLVSADSAQQGAQNDEIWLGISMVELRSQVSGF